MTDHPKFDELELLAYADGFLDDDPLRKSDLERRISASSAELERVRAFESQNRALRAIGRERLREPIPSRLLQTLEYTPRCSKRTAKRIAAMTATVIVTTATGWFIGHYDRQRDWSPRQSIEQAYKDYFAQELASLPRVGSEELQQANEENAPTGRLSMVFQVPNLAKYGFAIVQTHTPSKPAGEVARLTYRSQSGEEFSLFVRARWKEQGTSIQTDKDGDVSVAFWLDGPLASAVVSKLPAEKTRAIAEAVRKELRAQNMRMPVYDAESKPFAHNPPGTVTQAIEPLVRPSPKSGDHTNLKSPGQNPL